MSQQAEQLAPLSRPKVASALLAVVVGFSAIATVILVPAPQHPGVATASLTDIAAGRAGLTDAERARAMASFMATQIDPLLDRAAARDREAADRAVERLHDHFEQFHSGVDRFTGDVTSWGTRFGVIKRQVGDRWHSMWNSDAREAQATAYIDGKFRQHIVDDAQLQKAVEEVVTQFMEDLRANRNRMLAEVNAAIRTADVPLHLASLDLTRVREAMQLEAQKITTNLATATVVNGVVAFTGSIVAEEIARRVTLQILARVATHMAAEVTVAGGATASSAAAGGAGGSLIGPAGTVVGFGVGIAVGVAIDWWMTARFEQKLAVQCHAFLDSVEQRILQGDDNETGLVELMNATMEANRITQHRAVYAGILESAS